MKLKEAIPDMQPRNPDRRAGEKTFPKKVSLEKQVTSIEQRLLYVEKSLEKFLDSLSKLTHGVDSEIKKDIDG